MTDMPPSPLSPVSLGPFAEPRPSMQGKYLIRNKRKAQIVAAVDAVLSLLPIRRRAPPPRLQRVLLSDWGHLGDVVTTFGAITALRERHPGVEIGMIVSSWAKPAIAAAGLVDHIHVMDHQWMSRAKTSWKEKRRRFRDMRSIALREIKALRYEVAIDFLPFFPPAHVLFFKARIPIRVGFTSGGFGPLLTHPVLWPNAERPIADHYRALLDALHPDHPFAPDALRPRRSREELVALPKALFGASPYIVLHPGAGADYKDWGMDQWRALIPLLKAQYPGHVTAITGAGSSEIAMVAALAQDHPDLINLAGTLDWEGFVSVIAHAALVICPDTATGHVAAVFDTPVVSIFTGTNITAQWAPYTDEGRVLLHPVLCAPCHRGGCAVMACIRGIQPGTVMSAAKKLLAPDTALVVQR